jgi:uncharacterized protein YcnI
MDRRPLLVSAITVAALALPGGAQAAVTLQPDTAAPGRFTRLDLRVPTERDKPTRQVILQMPAGFAFASYEPVAGWDVRMSTQPLMTPIKTADGAVIDQEVTRIRWTARSPQAAVPPGAFQDFGLAVRIPDGKLGSKLTFQALQVYQGGEVVRWSGSADSAAPAPQVTLANVPNLADAATRAASGAALVDGPAATVPTDLPSRNLVFAALAAGAVGLLAGLIGMRRRA